MTTTSIIPSYPYVQFSDDVNISAWFSAYNTYAQEYLDWFNNTPLAIYTNDTISGPLLDWVANGVYGIYRVPIANNKTQEIGAVNTYTPNYLPFNQRKVVSTGTVTTMTDDIFKRLITWDFFKGDGMQFTIPWIKRRVARFIYGIGGFSDTNNISVTFTAVRTVQITVKVDTDYTLYAQQLVALLNAGIPNFPYGYDVSMIWMGTSFPENDFGDDIL